MKLPKHPARPTAAQSAPPNKSRTQRLAKNSARFSAAQVDATVDQMWLEAGIFLPKRFRQPIKAVRGWEHSTAHQIASLRAFARWHLREMNRAPRKEKC